MEKQYTPEEIEQLSREIDQMDHQTMARIWRFELCGSPYFRSDLPLFQKFMERFSDFGGMTCELSKLIGWEP